MIVRFRPRPLAVSLVVLIAVAGPQNSSSVAANSVLSSASARASASGRVVHALGHAAAAARPRAVGVARLMRLTALPSSSTHRLQSQDIVWCGWVRDCTFQTYQPGQSTANWSPITDPNGCVGSSSASGGVLSLGFCTGTQQAVQFGSYPPSATFAYTLTFSARAVPNGDQDAQLYVGFTATPTSCSNNFWFRIYASSGWQQYSYAGSGSTPPPLFCFFNDYGNHATVQIQNPSLTISENGHIVSPFPTPVSGTIPWHPHHSVRLSDGLSASVDLADGHVDVSSAEVDIPGRGLALSKSSTWDSTLAQAGVTSPNGQGWLSELTPSIGGVLTGTVVYTDATGATWPFVYAGNVTDTAPFTDYTSPPGYPWQLAATNLARQTVGYTLTNILSSQVITFNQAGVLQGTADAYGNANTLVPGASGPTGLANSGGRSLAFTYTNALLSEASSPLWRASGGVSGQDVTYSYNSGGACGAFQLCTMTRGAGTNDAATTTFGYTGTQLVTITTPYTQATHAWTIGYDWAGRVATITSPVSGTAGQAGYTPAYTTQFSYSPGQTVVTQGAGTSAALAMTYTLDTAGEATATQDGAGDTTQTAYDADHDVLSATDGDHNTTTSYYAYVGPNGYSGPIGAQGTTGLVTETVQPPISPFSPMNVASSPVITHSYDPQSHDLLSTFTSRGDITLDTYDGHHSVQTQSELTGYSACLNAPRRRIEIRPFGQCQRNYLWRGTINHYDPYGERVATVDGRGVDETLDGTGIATLGTCQNGDRCAASYTHSYTYTAQGDLAATWTPPITTTLGGVQSTGPVTTSYGYDLDGNQTSVTSANNQGSGNTTTSGYDHLGRLVSTTLPPVQLYTGQQAQPMQSTGYDGEGHVVRQTDGNGDTTLSSYDPLGRLVGSTDPVQGTTLYTYTATEQVAVQDPLDQVTNSQYDAAGRLTLVTDPLGNTTQRQYDGAGNTVVITSGTPLAATQVETRTFDGLNRVVTDTLSLPGVPPTTTVTGYDLDGNVAQVEQPNGDTVFDTYDLVHQLTYREVDTAPVLTQTNIMVEGYTYDDAGNQATGDDFDQRATTLTYDGDSRLVQSVAVTNSLPLTTALGYDPDGNTISQLLTPAVGATSSYTAAVNAADWTTSTRQDGLLSVYQYDGAGRQRSQSVAQGTTPANTTLDKEGRATAIGENVGGTGPYTSTFGYYANDLPYTASLPGGLGISVLDQYDPADRLVTATLAGPLIQTPGLLTNTSVLSSTYGYGYTPLGWTSAATSTVSSVVTATQLAHDPLGRLTQAAGPPGDLWLTRPTTTTHILNGAACPSVSVCYAVGNSGVILGSTDGGATWSGQSSGVTSALNAVACPSAATCYAVGDGGVIRMTNTGGASWVSSSSGITTNLESVTCPTSGTCYAAGAGGKILLLSGSSWSTETTPVSSTLWGISCSDALTCTAVGSLGKILGTTDGTTWSAETRPTTLQLNGVSCPTSSFCAAVGVTGTIAISTGAGGGGWALQTSNTSQALTGVACPSASQCLAVGASGTLLGTADAGQLWTTQMTTSTATLQGVSCADTSTCVAVGANGTILSSSGRSGWSYDGNGNLLTSDTDGITTTYSYASAITPNLVLTLTTPGQLNRYYGYDQNGDTTAITTSTGSLNTQLSYDSQARPITVTLADGTQVVQGYNAQGQRASYTVSKAGVTSYAAQLTYRGAELGQAVVSGAQAYTDTYLYGPSGLPLELLRQQGGTTSRYYYEEDGRGNVVAVTNISGTVVDHYSYDVWGRLMSASEQVPQRLRYGGYWYDAELGWYWVSVRFYDPVLERWLQPDPSQQDGVRTFVYVHDMPVDASDPTGLAGAVNVPEDGGVSFIVVGIAAVVAIAASPEILAGAGIALGATVVIGGIAYTVSRIQIGQPGTIVVPAYTSQPGEVQATQVAGGTTLTAPSQIKLPPMHLAKASKGRPESNVAQNRQFGDAVQAIQRQIGRKLSKDEIRQLHDALHEEGNPGYQDIVDLGIALFG